MRRVDTSKGSSLTLVRALIKRVLSKLPFFHFLCSQCGEPLRPNEPDVRNFGSNSCRSLERRRCRPDHSKQSRHYQGRRRSHVGHDHHSPHLGNMLAVEVPKINFGILQGNFRGLLRFSFLWVKLETCAIFFVLMEWLH